MLSSQPCVRSHTGVYWGRNWDGIQSICFCTFSQISKTNWTYLRIMWVFLIPLYGFAMCFSKTCNGLKPKKVNAPIFHFHSRRRQQRNKGRRKQQQQQQQTARVQMKSMRRAGSFGKDLNDLACIRK